MTYMYMLILTVTYQLTLNSKEVLHLKDFVIIQTSPTKEIIQGNNS